jgi:hypothetical protein
MTSRTAEFEAGHAHAYPEIHASDLSTDDARRSREVSSSEFQSIAAAGAARYDVMKAKSAEPKGLDAHWGDVVNSAYEATREPWGGATYHGKTGKALAAHTNSYALTAREPGAKAVSVAPGASHEEFSAAMDNARREYSPALRRQGHHLGVFHDEDKGSIDIDPVVIVHNRRQVEEIGAYTRATGGAYHFKSGEGYWPPHVKG